jgi:endonuclease/exonuclease/phosphatase family metal-dependent hydrolase
MGAMTRHSGWVLIAVVAAFSLGCDDGDGDGGGGSAGTGGTLDGTGGGDGSGGGESPTLRVATYNGGLASGFVDYAAERRGQVASGLAGLSNAGLDALCVQEFWEQSDWDAVVAGAGSLQHAHRAENSQEECASADDAAACPAEFADPLETCARAACPDVAPGELSGCVLNNCDAEFNALPNDCVTCIAGALGGSLDEILASCGPGAGPALCYAYDGSFGTGILSRYPIADRDVLVMESHLNRRGVLYARITDTPLGEVHFFCTHLTSNLSQIPFPEDEGSWAEEQRAQIDEMRAWAEMKASGGQIVMAGDFNCGPAPGTGDGQAELIENYEALSDGFDATYTAQADSVCTYCADNLLVEGENADNSESELIDHLLLKGFTDVTARGERILDDNITIQVEGADVETAYSDHYGVMVTIE